MKIAYITMQFPVPSETFASLEVDQIRNYGNDIEIYCLRNKHKNYRELLNQRQHDGIYISNFRFSSLLRFVRFLFTNPIKCFLLFSWIFKCCYKKPIHLIKSIVLYPSAISIFMEIKEKNFDVVHLYWGHYTSLVGYLVNKYNSQAVLSMFLGAHDLRVNFPSSVYLHRQADCCFTQVKKNREILDLFGYDADRFKVIYDGIIIDKEKKLITILI